MDTEGAQKLGEDTGNTDADDPRPDLHNLTLPKPERKTPILRTLKSENCAVIDGDGAVMVLLRPVLL